MGASSKKHFDWYRGLEYIGLAVFLSANLLTFYLATAAGWSQRGIWWQAPLALFLGWIGADFLVGLVHWLFDNYFNERTLFFGPRVVQPFRSHHSDPTDITRHSLGELLGNSAILGTPLQFLLAWEAESNPALVLGCNCMAFFGVCANVFHSWSHTKGISGWRRLLQRSGLVLEAENHDVHHTAPHDSYYCVCSGFMNPILGWLHFFPMVEWIIERVTGIAPMHRRGAADTATVNQTP
ncbi:MAG: fatty acid desaturase family protein [Leptospirales bacterium]|nr:fatty acid desaturase family protein [Leptospirales bacterium]